MRTSPAAVTDGNLACRPFVAGRIPSVKAWADPCGAAPRNCGGVCHGSRGNGHLATRHGHLATVHTTFVTGNGQIRKVSRALRGIRCAHCRGNAVCRPLCAAMPCMVCSLLCVVCMLHACNVAQAGSDAALSKAAHASDSPPLPARPTATHDGGDVESQDGVSERADGRASAERSRSARSLAEALFPQRHGTSLRAATGGILESGTHAHAQRAWRGTRAPFGALSRWSGCGRTMLPLTPIAGYSAG